MTVVNISEARTQLSKLVARVEHGAQDEIIITRHGRPVARLIPLATKERRPVVLGLAKGLFEPPQFPDGMDEEVAALFYESKD